MQTTQKIIIVIGMFLFMLNSSMAAGIEVNGTITIGKKTSSDCSGFGICRMDKSTKALNSGAVPSSFVYDAKAKTLLIKINKADLEAENSKKANFFKIKNKIDVEAPITVPSDLRSALKAQHSIVIKKGSYKISYQKGVYIIHIKL